MADKKVIIQKKKEFTFRGRTLEDLKRLDIREFGKLIPSRERRTLLRNTDVVETFLARSNKKIERNKRVRTHDRNIIVVPGMIGMQIGVYNGRQFNLVDIIPEMLGHRLGEFSPTRNSVKHGAAGIGATRSSASRSVK
ncbi:30S ribosomal protein S19 [Candidatus Pacearchaeota archaeon]|nr:30S ribosomal protein S19 [Candidatus Pacearchaeota archaeon]|tara:strand:+ start:8866 stop:9279 length:414 start_codon:yes stop_codon:yes gene_type:complete